MADNKYDPAMEDFRYRQERQREISESRTKWVPDADNESGAIHYGGTPGRFSMGGRYISQTKEQQDYQEKLRIKAEFDANMFEKQYTMKQKLDISRFQRAKNDIDANQDFSDTEKTSVRRALDLKLMGIMPSELPKTNPWPKGQSIGDSYPKYGGVARRNKDGIEEILYRPDQMPDWQKREHEIKLQAAKDSRESEKRSHVMDLLSKGAYAGTDELGKAKFEKLDLHAARRVVDTIYGDREEWWNRAEDQGFEVADEDRDLPEQVGYSKTYIQNMIKQFGSFDNLPPEAQDAYRQAIEVLREYQNSR